MDEQNQKVNINNVPVSQPTNPAGKPRVVWLILILLVLAAIIFALWHLNSKKAQPQPQQKVTTQTPAPVVEAQPLTTQQMQANVMAKGKIVLPAVKASVTANANSLPVELKALVLSGASGTAIKKLTYTDGRDGFEITYSAQGLVSVVRAQIKTALAKWQFLSGAMGNNIASLEAQDSNYEVKINLTASDASAQSSADIYVITNN